MSVTSVMYFFANSASKNIAKKRLDPLAENALIVNKILK